ncbi:unnamed protein product [Pleuronectes platessa]|uniref:Uncharacterized protein n=1 Tax=Pleuronectes platessa TaxID=8262 RepID=A0A9N7TPU7_PLEPL|nr:unnamed protein product [Pleuronectes platessa]
MISSGRHADRKQLLCRNVMSSAGEEGKVHSGGVACLCGAPGAHRRIGGWLMGRGGTRGRHEEEERSHSEKYRLLRTKTHSEEHIGHIITMNQKAYMYVPLCPKPNDKDDK